MPLATTYVHVTRGQSILAPPPPPSPGAESTLITIITIMWYTPLALAPLLTL